MTEFLKPTAVQTHITAFNMDHVHDTLAAQNDPFTRFIHIGGPSSVGKSTVSRLIATEIPDTQVLSVDSYLIEGLGKGNHNFNDDSPDPAQPYIGGISPKVWELSLLAKHLQELRAGRAVQVPIFNETVKDREGYYRLEPSKQIIVEGGHAFSKEFRDFSSYSILLEAPLHDRLIRKIVRTHLQYGRDDVDEVAGRYFARDEPAWELLRMDHRSIADQIVHNPSNPEIEFRDAKFTPHAPLNGSLLHLRPKPEYGNVHPGELFGIEFTEGAPRLRYGVYDNQLVNLPIAVQVAEQFQSYYNFN